MPPTTPRHSLSPRVRAFTQTELIILIVVICVAVALVAVCGLAGIMLPALGKARQSARQLKDSTQVRGIVQSLVVWGSNNRNSYPLPSAIDVKDTTVPELGEAKNTSGNILSLLIFNGGISTEICISPAESNTGQIQRYDNYQYNMPPSAVSPANAFWDPAFRATPDDTARGSAAGVGHQSYAHTIPIGKRLEQWKDTYNSTEAVFGNRGPTYSQSDAAHSSAVWSLLPGPLGTQSNTLLIHGGRNTWEGNIGYNDNHVNFEVSPVPPMVRFPIGPPPAKGKLGPTAPDNLFVNETDEFEGDTIAGHVDQGANAYLRPISKVTIPPAPPKAINPPIPSVWRD